MHHPNIDFDPPPGFPIWKYLAIIAVLQALPWLGVECLLGWCVVQGEYWPAIGLGLAFPVFAVLAGARLLMRKMREDAGQNGRTGRFWLGLAAGVFLGAGMLFLIGLILWNPPF